MQMPYSIDDIMEMGIVQFNEVVETIVRINDKSKTSDNQNLTLGGLRGN